MADPAPAEDETDPRYRAVVVGYGPVGRTVTRLLRENEIEPVNIRPHPYEFALYYVVSAG